LIPIFAKQKDPDVVAVIRFLSCAGNRRVGKTSVTCATTVTEDILSGTSLAV
jgi:hypothetical protein